jgi:nucleoside-diphosphate-sugar epimerase
VRTVVTGGSGFVGSHVCDALRKSGRGVTVFTRRGKNGKSAESPGFIPVDYTDVDLLAAALLGVDEVVHCAGAVRAVSEEKYFAANVLPTRNLSLAAAAAGVARFVLVSSLAAGGPSSREKRRDESDPDDPLTWYGQSKYAAELEARHFAPGLTIVRPCAVYGPGDWDIFLVFRSIARLGLDIRPSGGTPLLSFIEGTDVARAIAAILDAESTIGRTYYLAGEGVSEWGDFTNRVSEALGVKNRVLNIPRFAADIYGFLLLQLARITGKPTVISPEKLYEMRQEAWTCSSERLAADCGFRPMVSLGDGVRATAVWYRAKGWL